MSRPLLWFIRIRMRLRISICVGLIAVLCIVVSLVVRHSWPAFGGMALTIIWFMWMQPLISEGDHYDDPQPSPRVIPSQRQVEVMPRPLLSEIPPEDHPFVARVSRGRHIRLD